MEPNKTGKISKISKKDEVLKGYEQSVCQDFETFSRALRLEEEKATFYKTPDLFLFFMGYL